MGSETADTLRELIFSNLATFDTSIDALKHHFTFVTDCAATMPAVFGASVSPSRILLSELWVGYVPQQLNTAMKYRYYKGTE